MADILAETFFTREQIAERLKVTPQSVYRWDRQGKIRSFRAGGLVRYTESALREFLLSGVRQG